MTNEHTSLEKYASHTLFEMVAKGLLKGYVWEVSWRLNRDCDILTSCYSVFSSTSFSSCGDAQLGVLRASLWWELVLTASNCNKLTPIDWPCCRTGLYHCLTSTCFLWASHLHPLQPIHSQGYTLISSTGCTCSLIDDWVRGQYLTQRSWYAVKMNNSIKQFKSHKMLWPEGSLFDSLLHQGVGEGANNVNWCLNKKNTFTIKPVNSILCSYLFFVFFLYLISVILYLPLYRMVSHKAVRKRHLFIKSFP